MDRRARGDAARVATTSDPRLPAAGRMYGSMASMVKVTFTFDDDTVARLRRTAARLAKPQSYVVRESIREYEARSTKLSDEERKRLLAAVARMMKQPPTRSATAVDEELREIRASRRRWARRRRPS